MTSLVDVIFLLLLFFMLTSTFSKFSEVTLSAASATASGGGANAGEAPIFLQLYPEHLTVNGETTTIEALALEPQGGQALLISLQSGISAQRLTDVLVALRRYPDLVVSVLGAG